MSLPKNQKVQEILDLDTQLQRQTIYNGWPEAWSHLKLPFGVSRALLVIDNGDAHTPSEIAEVLKVSRTTVSGLLDRLEAAQLIKRAIDPNDRRSFLLELTEAGSQLAPEIDNLPPHPLQQPPPLPHYSPPPPLPPRPPALLNP